MAMKAVKDVDEYIALAPKEVQGRLKDLRAAIKATAPEALEKISYGIPYYGYKGRLVYFAYTNAFSYSGERTGELDRTLSV